MLMARKSCNVCGVTKSLSEFPKAKTCADGHRNKCKDCTYSRQKAWKEKNRDKYNEAQRRYNKAKYASEAFRTAKSERERVYREKNPHKVKLKSYINYDKRKGLLSNIDLDYCVREMSKPCFYCGFVDPLCNGLDRIDNSLGHTVENCVTCCSLCNFTRMNNYTHNEFIEFIAPGIVELRKRRGDYVASDKDS